MLNLTMKRVVALAGAAAFVGAFTLGALPAAASTQSNYIKALHRAAPATKKISTKKLVGLGKSICDFTGVAPASAEVKLLDESSNSFRFPKRQVSAIVSTSVAYLCPTHVSKPKVAVAAPPATTQPTQPAPPTTTAPTTPPLTQQQKSAAASAKQYLSTQAFSQQGLINQLDSSAGDGYSVNDATVAVDSLTVDWNAEAVQAAKAYLQTQPFSCTDLINQLDSSAGDQYTVAQATYGATQAGDCAGGVPSGNSGNTGNS
jgi:hypothetical protein